MYKNARWSKISAPPREQNVAYLQPERDLSIAGMYIQSRETSINRRHVYTKQREVYQSPACIYKAERGLSIAGMYIQSRQHQARTEALSCLLRNAIRPAQYMPVERSADLLLKCAVDRPYLLQNPPFWIQNSIVLNWKFIVFNRTFVTFAMRSPCLKEAPAGIT